MGLTYAILASYILVTELEHHRQIHQVNLSVYKNLEQRYLQEHQQPPPNALCQYLTIRYSIRYETHWLAWCEEVIELLKSFSTENLVTSSSGYC